MADTLDVLATRDMFVAAAEAMLGNIDRLTAADQAIGDGDHGIGMKRGFEAVLDWSRKTTPASVADVFKGVGNAVMANTGGASGAIFGTLFRAGAQVTAEATSLDAKGFAAFLAEGLVAVEKRGGAKPGGKTLIDALEPAARAAEATAHSGLAPTVAAAAAAALEGVEATRGMIATTGKARTLGERSLGHPDPGAISLSIVLGAMSRFVADAAVPAAAPS
jgi:dihydroxyacetone kinase-like protein